MKFLLKFSILFCNRINILNPIVFVEVFNNVVLFKFSLLKKVIAIVMF